MLKAIKHGTEKKKSFGARSTDGKKTKGMKLCGNCGAVYYSGHWHNSPAIASVMRKGKKPGASSAELCYECRWLANGRDPKLAQFEGQVTLDGLKDIDEKEMILNEVRNIGGRAQKRDPLEHIIAIDDRGERVVITTTENQLAVAIGKEVAAAFKGGKLTITFSDGNLPARVHWAHKP